MWMMFVVLENKKDIKQIMQQIEKIYSIKRVGELPKCIRVNIKMKDDDLCLSQKDI
jgi:acetolactate synthase small subunit